MKTRKKFAVLALSAAVLAGAWLLAEYTIRMPAEPVLASVDETAETIDLSIGRAREITALSWSWEGRTVNLRWDDAAARWMNADDADCPVNNAAALALARAAAEAKASMAIENVTEFGQYGLDKPALTVVAATEEDTAAYEVGNMSITGEYYMRRSGESTVYLESGTLAAFQVGLEDILELDCVPQDIAEVTGLQVASEAGDYEIRYCLEPEPGWYRLEGETAAPLKEDRVRMLTDILREAAFSECVAWNADPAEYGFTEPLVRSTLSYADELGRESSFTLEFGDYAGSEVYVRFPGSEMVYLMSASVPDALMYPDWSAMEPATVMTVLDTEDISSIRIGLDGQSLEILRLEETEELPAEEGEEPVSVTDVIYSANGWVLETGKVEKWLTALAGLTADDTAPAGEGRRTLLTVTLAWKDPEGVPAELELRSYDSAHDLCIIGGDRYLLVPKTEADALAAEAAGFFAGEVSE